MAAPDHFEEAERLLAEARFSLGDGTYITHLLAAAQVHATLTLTATLRELPPGGW